MTQAEEHPVPNRVARWASSLDPVAAGAAWLLFFLAFPFLEEQGFGVESLIGGGLIGLLLALLRGLRPVL